MYNNLRKAQNGVLDWSFTRFSATFLCEVVFFYLKWSTDERRWALTY